MVTLGHNTIHTYSEYTQKLIERFDKKYPEIHFRELAQLKQTGTSRSLYLIISEDSGHGNRCVREQVDYVIH